MPFPGSRYAKIIAFDLRPGLCPGPTLLLGYPDVVLGQWTNHKRDVGVARC